MKTKAYGILVVFLLITCIYFFEKDRIHHLEAPVKKGTNIVNAPKSDNADKVSEYVHPEQKGDEEFFGNIHPYEYNKTVWMNVKGEKLQIPLVMIQDIKKGGIIPKGYESSYGQISDESKRLGKVAYDVNGDTISYLRPVFIKKAEDKKNKY